MTEVELKNLVKSVRSISDMETAMKRYYAYQSFHTANTKAMWWTNTVLNVAACLACIYVLHLELWQYPLVMIAFDIALTGLEFVLMKYYAILHKFILSAKRRDKYIEKLKAVYEKNKALYKQYRNDEIRMSYADSQALVEDIRELEGVLYEFEQQKKELEEAKILEADVVKKKELETIADYQAVITDLEMQDFSFLPAVARENISRVLSRSTDLLNELDNNKAAFTMAQDTFNIYLTEMINVITQIGQLDKEQQAEYEPTLKQVVDEYDKYIERQSDRVRKFNSNSININLNTLLSELKEGE